MQVIHARNVNEAYIRGLRYLHGSYRQRESRNGPVLVSPTSVTTHYSHPNERVLWSGQRDANPFFHVWEALWMLSGCNDVKTLAYIVPNIAQYSDDGHHFHGAYGFRWRTHFHSNITFRHIDQLHALVTLLKDDPDTRRAYLQMWDPSVDLLRNGGKDLPCNVGGKFEIMDGALNLLIFNRSNDVIWGCYGANVVHFSMLLEYIAARVGVKVGWYEHVSANFHVYSSIWDKVWPIHLDSTKDWYHHVQADAVQGPSVLIRPLVDNPATFDDECARAVEQFRLYQRLTEQDTRHFENGFLREVAQPMSVAYNMFRRHGASEAREYLTASIGEFGRIDWLVAGWEWMNRRALKTRKQQATEDAGSKSK